MNCLVGEGQDTHCQKDPPKFDSPSVHLGIFVLLSLHQEVIQPLRFAPAGSILDFDHGGVTAANSVNGFMADIGSGSAQILTLTGVILPQKFETDILILLVVGRSQEVRPRRSYRAPQVGSVFLIPLGHGGDLVRLPLVFDRL